MLHPIRPTAAAHNPLLVVVGVLMLQCSTTTLMAMPVLHLQVVPTIDLHLVIHPKAPTPRTYGAGDVSRLMTPSYNNYTEWPCCNYLTTID